MPRRPVPCLYLHGFNSSPASQKAQQLQAFYTACGAAELLRIPELSPFPAQAIAQAEAELRSMMAAHGGDVLIIGSSLGGYYARYLAERHGVRAVMINPAIRPFELLAAYLGENRNLYTGATYQLGPEHMQQLLDMHITVLSQPLNCLLLLQTGDETLDYREASAEYLTSPMLVSAGGNHSYEDFTQRIPLILEFAKHKS
ncbi:MAG: esterase [Oceanospirillaceae bacterium]|nr:esterase [Oceanospirillaceae bacterium]